MNLIETEPGVYSVLLDGACYEVRVLGNEVTVNGRLFEIAVEDPRQWRRRNGTGGAQGRVSITAPMPGKVVRLLVAEGDTVTAGQPVVVVEAMKMQNELKSPRDGQVTSIRAQENDSVNAGAVLVLIE